MTERIFEYLRSNDLPTPCLIVDLAAVEQAYRDLSRAFPDADIFYAVKANPEPAIVQALNELGCAFDVASPTEIDLCLQSGAPFDRLSYSNTIKKPADIGYAHKAGIDLFAFDCDGELEKIAGRAPGAQVICRIATECKGAEWPLSRKFGCSPVDAIRLLKKAKEIGLTPYGVSFHVGSQQTDVTQWDYAIGVTAEIFERLSEDADIDLEAIDLGGGFPARYRDPVDPLARYSDTIHIAIEKHFGNHKPRMILEPGRSLVGDAGVIESEIVLVSTRDTDPERRWVYLDVGRYHGLAETMDESIRYRVRTAHDGKEDGPVVLAGPTCDSTDILYEKADYRLPRAIKAGERIQLLSTGAYTASYSSVGFNGFPPLKTYCI